MRLTDIMSGAGLAFYAEVALALFLLAFAMVAATVVARRNQKTWENARWMPLSDDVTPPPTHPTDDQNDQTGQAR